MESAKRSALLLLAMLTLSSSPLALACNSCGSSTPSTGTPAGGVSIPPVVGKVTPVVGGVVGGAVPVVGGVAPVVGGIAGKVTPVVGGVTPAVGGVTPAVGGIVVAPVVGGVAPVVGGIVGTITPVVGGITGGSPKVRHGGRKACPPPPYTPTPAPTPPYNPTPAPTPSYDTCPIDALKLGVCIDLLGNDVHIGDANVQCCPLINGVAGLSAAACLCTAIKAKVLDLSIYVPLALKLLVNCGCAVPPGYTCA